MIRRIESEDSTLERPAAAAVSTTGTSAVAPAQFTDDDAGEILPQGHPKWVRDGFAVSQRARDALARLQPIVVQVLRFWDHRLRSIRVTGRRLSVDASGSYRVD